MKIYDGLENEINAEDPTVRMIALFHHFLGVVLAEASAEPDPWEQAKIYEKALSGLRDELSMRADRASVTAFLKSLTP